MRPELIIFDCDGVLVDSEGIANRVFAECLTASGLPMTAEECLKKYKGGKFPRIKNQIELETGRSLGRGWISSMYERQFEAFRDELVAIPHVDQAIGSIKQAGVSVCVASNGPLEKMDVTLGITGLRSLFAGKIFSADFVANPKPAPDLFLWAIDDMNVTADKAVVIEDSPTGVKAAVAAGIPVLGYAGDGDEDALHNAGASEVFTSMQQLTGLLNL